MSVFCLPHLLWCLLLSIMCVSINDEYGTFFEKCIRLSICQNISVCLSIHLSICGAKGKCSAWVSSWTQAQSACLPHSFRQHQILYYFVTDSMDCLKVSMYSSAATKSWLHVNVNSSSTSYLLHHHVTSLVCMSVVKKSLTSLSDRQQYSVGQICSTKHNTRFRSLLAQDLWMNPL